MIGPILIVVGSVGASLALSYAWWCKARVVNLRQQIYDERDRLFDCAMNLRALDDPAYKLAREHLNAVASSANLVSILVFAYVMASGVKHIIHLEKTSNESLRLEIDATLERCARILTNYLLFHTLTGLAVLGAVQVNRLRWVAEYYIVHWSHRWMRSLLPDEIDRGRGGFTSC